MGEIARCIYESLALCYKNTLEQMQQLTGKRFSVLHMLGGGCNAALLCQLTADALGIPVKAGPVEATALGNIILQLKALGELETIGQGRALIAATEPIKQYYPIDQENWIAYTAFKNVLEK